MNIKPAAVALAASAACVMTACTQQPSAAVSGATPAVTSTSTAGMPTFDDTTTSVPDDLVGSWTLVAWSDPSPLSDSPITLVVDAQGVHGNSGCNAYSGQLLESDMSAFRIGGLAVTAMACLGPAGTAESTYLWLLYGAYGEQVTGDSLVLWANGVEALTFTRTK